MYNNLSLIKPKPGIQLNRAHPLAQGLEAYWPMNEGSGTVTRDVVGGKPGTLTNFALAGSSTSGWTGTRMGGGLRFDGTDDYVNIGTDYQKYIKYDKSFSVSIWFTFSAVAASYYSLIGAVRDTGGYDSFEIRKSSSHRIEFLLWTYAGGGNTNGYNWGSDVQTFIVGKLYNVTVTYNGTGTSTAGNIYINGNSVYSGTIVNNFGDLTSSFSAQLDGIDLWIGRRNYTSPDMPFPGVIDSVRFYNRVLNQSEIQILMTNPHIDFHSGNLWRKNPTLYGLGAWKGDLITAGASGTLTADSVDNNVEAAMALSFKKA